MAKRPVSRSICCDVLGQLWGCCSMAEEEGSEVESWKRERWRILSFEI